MTIFGFSIYRAVINCLYLSINGIRRLSNGNRFTNGSIVIGYEWHDGYCLFVARTLLLVRLNAKMDALFMWALCFVDGIGFLMEPTGHTISTKKQKANSNFYEQ